MALVCLVKCSHKNLNNLLDIIILRKEKMAIEIFSNSLEPVISFLQNHPNTSGFITFFVVFCEAMAVIGVVVPGTITMTAIGILVGYGTIPTMSTFGFAILGAITGDYISYILGVYYKDKLHKMWPFRKHPKLLSYGEKFFHAHGGKSIIIGRFVGPMRAMLPMVAGMLRMPQGRFLLAAIPSASLWAVLYILPGVLIGALAMQLSTKKAAEILVWILVALAIIWLVVWLLMHFFKRICRFFDRYIKKLWESMEKSSYFHWLTSFLKNPRRLEHHQQLTLLIFAIITLSLFIVVLVNVLMGGNLTTFNAPLYYLLQSIRNPNLDHIMLFFTFLADTKALLFAEVIFISWLASKRYWYTLIHAVVILGVSYLSLGCIKFLTHIPRPGGFVTLLNDFSFPSGHTGISIAVYGFLAEIIGFELKSKLRWIPYAVAATIVTLVSISRLYLGAHWLTDVCGGALLGLTILLLVTISYRRHGAKTHPVKMSIVAVSSFSIVLILYSVAFFNKQFNIYAPRQVIKSINIKDWESQNKRSILSSVPLCRVNRLGYPKDAFNIQFRGDIEDIKRNLIKHGWVNHNFALDLQEIIRRLDINKKEERLPIVPQLFNNKPEVLFLTKYLLPTKQMVILRLWDSDIDIEGDGKHLFVGVVNFYTANKLDSFLKPSERNKKFKSAINNLIPELGIFKWRTITLSKDKQPENMCDLNWDGQILIIDHIKKSQ